MTLRLADAQDKQLAEVALSLGLSKQQAVEKAIEQFLERESQNEIVGKIFDLVSIRDRELLERLSDA